VLAGRRLGKLAASSAFPAVPWPMSAGLVEREVQRSVHPRMSRQYQRRSAQALPPSATMWPGEERIPHIQQVVTETRPRGAGTRLC